MTAHLATRSADAPLTFDSLAGAIRDDTRFALIRVEGHLTIEVAIASCSSLTEPANTGPVPARRCSAPSWRWMCERAVYEARR